MAYEDSDYYAASSSEKKWKIFKKESNKTKSSATSIDPSLMRSYSSSNSPPFLRSYSQKPYTTQSSSLCRSSSMKSPCSTSPNLRRSASTKNGKSTVIGSFSKKSSAFGKKCTNMAKEHKARFYIVKRCVSMLVSWRKNDDS